MCMFERNRDTQEIRLIIHSTASDIKVA